MAWPASSSGNLIARRFLAQKLHVFRPRQRDEDAHSRRGAAIQKPERRDVINPDDVQPGFSHLREIAVHLLGRTEIMTFRIRLEWTVGDPFDKKLPVAFEEEFRDRTDRVRGTHSRVG